MVVHSAQRLRNLFFFLFLAILTSTGNTFGFPIIYPKGTTIYKPAKVYEGYTIFVSYAINTILLVNMEGDICHYWTSPADYHVQYAEPLTNGHLLAHIRYRSDADGRRSLLAEVDWNSNIVWEYIASADYSWFHHDFERLENGNTLILCGELKNVPVISPQDVVDDYIIEVNPDGEIVWEWHTCEHFDEFGFSDEAKELIFKQGGDWAHTNSIQSLPVNSLGDPRFNEGNILVSQRESNIIFVIDKNTGEIVWKIGPDDSLTIGQHNVQMIRDGLTGAGNIIVFDNGGIAGYPSNCRLYSRITEIAPVLKTIVWKYNALESHLPIGSFFSAFISGVQRLPNGNTLVNEGQNGRFFEITQDNEIVWEYINPFFGVETLNSHTYRQNKVYRVWRVDLDWPQLESR